MYRKIDIKHIDLSKFPKRIVNGKEVISWKETEGLETEFIYDGEIHNLKIVKYFSYEKIDIVIDGKIKKTVQCSKITKLAFGNELMKKKYKYNIGDQINGFEIIEHIEKKYSVNSKYRRAAYRCRCLIDGYIFEKKDYEIEKSGCPVCAHIVTSKGINDSATTDSWMVKYFENSDDAFKYAKNSNIKVNMKCPYCGTLKEMRIADLNKKGFSCPVCSDGISYPNKFAHELFSQLSGQYKEYVFEYSPDWAGLCKYDNYIKYNDGKEIIIEMDGGFHFRNDFKTMISKKTC